MSKQLFGFYRAVVEDNNDPDKRGRVRVRIWGLHTDKKTKTVKEGVPSNELPWAEPCLPIHEGGMTGFGMFGVPLQGSHVMVFFEAGNLDQIRYFASLPSYPTEKVDKTKGFNDPDGVYPKEQKLNEPDYHRLARGVTANTLVTLKNREKMRAIPTAAGGSWTEPSLYGAVYPHNMVTATHGGILTEMDSTPDAVRLHLYHPSNSYLEIGLKGDMILRNAGDRFDITIGSKHSYALLDDNTTAGANINVKGFGTITIKGGIVRIN